MVKKILRTIRLVKKEKGTILGLAKKSSCLKQISCNQKRWGL